MNSFVNIFTLVLMTSSGFLEDALVKKNKWFYIFDKRASTGELSHGENDVFVGWCHKQIVYIIILWVDSYEHVMWLENTQTLMRYSTSYLFIRSVTTARNDAAAMAQMIQQV